MEAFFHQWEFKLRYCWLIRRESRETSCCKTLNFCLWSSFTWFTAKTNHVGLAEDNKVEWVTEKWRISNVSHTQCQLSIPLIPPPKFQALFQSSLGLTIHAVDISPALRAREMEQTNGRIVHNKFGKLLIFYMLKNDL